MFYVWRMCLPSARSGRIHYLLLVRCRYFYIDPGSGAKYCDQRVCMPVCLLAYLKNHAHLQISPNCLYMLPVAVARSSSDDNAMCCVLPVMWLTSYFHIMERMGQNQG